MIDALFGALGSLFANAAGVLLLALVAGAIFLAWNWRLALLGVLFLHLGSASMLVYLHNVPVALAVGEMGAVFLCVAMLAIAGWLQPHSSAAGLNWPLRSLALFFILAGWWFLDPGYLFPGFSQAETELLLWIAFCGLALWSFSGSPLYGGIAVLLWSAPLYALAAVLMEGSGLLAIVGIMNLVAVLSCSYLTLLEPQAGRRSAPRRLQPALPRLRQAGSARPWGLMRRAPDPAALAVEAGGQALDQAPVQAAPVQSPVQAQLPGSPAREETPSL